MASVTSRPRSNSAASSNTIRLTGSARASSCARGRGRPKGTVADFSADFIVPVIQRLTISAGPRFTGKAPRRPSPYFGIDAVQSDGFRAAGVQRQGRRALVRRRRPQVSYRINPQWEVHSYIEYDRLLGDAASSPLVTLRGSPNQTTFGIGASYSFDFKIR